MERALLDGVEVVKPPAATRAQLSARLVQIEHNLEFRSKAEARLVSAQDWFQRAEKDYAQACIVRDAAPSHIDPNYLGAWRLRLGEELSALQKKVAALAERLPHVEAEALRRHREIEAGTKSNAALVIAEADADVAGRLVKFLVKNREEFMAGVWAEILSSASAFAAQATGGAITEVLRKDGAFYYIEDGLAKRASSQASGAQASILGLGLKLALSTSVPGSLNTLLLDEVTTDMRDDISAAVTALLGTAGHQVIAITHREMDRSGDYKVIAL
jgi:hypothetical protein